MEASISAWRHGSFDQPELPARLRGRHQYFHLDAEKDIFRVAVYIKGAVVCHLSSCWKDRSILAGAETQICRFVLGIIQSCRKAPAVARYAALAYSTHQSVGYCKPDDCLKARLLNADHRSARQGRRHDGA